MYIFIAFGTLALYGIIRKTVYNDMSDFFKMMITRLCMITLLSMIPLSFLGQILYFENTTLFSAHSFGFGFAVGSVIYIYRTYGTLFQLHKVA